MVYSTCSILQEENENIISDFLKKNKNFKITPIPINEKNMFYQYRENAGYLKVYPNKEIDGFFICKIKKM